MTGLLRKALPACCFLIVTSLSFAALIGFGHGFPGINPRPRQLIVSGDNGSGDDFPEMVSVAGGSFFMGDRTGESFSALPIREVSLEDFFISRYEITFCQYDRYCRDEGLPFPPDGGYGRTGRPVGNVSWFDAVGYCNWLSRAQGLEPCYEILPSGMDAPGLLPQVTCDLSRNGYRLPTEAEWEYAASGGEESRMCMYAGSNDVDEVAWYFDNAGRYPNPVGGKKPNELGLYDMSGNVYEWTNDWLTGDYSNLPSPEVNPPGASQGNAKAVRGGSCFFDSWGCRVWYRKGRSPEFRLPYLGFRVMRGVNLDR